MRLISLTNDYLIRTVLKLNALIISQSFSVFEVTNYMTYIKGHAILFDQKYKGNIDSHETIHERTIILLLEENINFPILNECLQLLIIANKIFKTSLRVKSEESYSYLLENSTSLVD